MTQNHIHLSTELGDAPELAPDIKWLVRADEYKEIPNVTLTFRRTIHGKLIKHVQRDVDGDILQFVDYQYGLVLYDYDGMTLAERKAALYAMQGKVVYLVDAVSSINDGADHTADIKTMFLSAVSESKNIEPSISRLYYTIQLTDNRV